MPKHTHEWDDTGKTDWQRSPNTGEILRWVSRYKVEIMPWDRVMRRLNATETLSAKDAEIASYSFKDTTSKEHQIQLSLRAYAAALEGEDARTHA